MGVDEGNLQVLDVDVILENCPTTIVIINLLVYSTIQYSTIVIIVSVIQQFFFKHDKRRTRPQEECFVRSVVAGRS